MSKTTTLTYAFGDLVAVETPLGHAEQRFVDAAGRLARVTDAKGAATWLTYDAHDQTTKIVDPLGGETTFTYDENGNLLTLTDARGKTTTWTYDTMDRVATRTDPLDRTESFTYDLHGNLATWTDRKGQVTTYQYDALDRQVFVGFGTTEGPTYASTIATTYDAGDRAIESYRVYRRALPERGWSPWHDPASTPQSYVNAPSAWSSTTPLSTPRSGPRCDRSPRNWAARSKRSGGGSGRRNVMPGSVLA